MPGMRPCLWAPFTLVLLALAVTGPTFARSLKQGPWDVKVKGLASQNGIGLSSLNGLAARTRTLQAAAKAASVEKELPRTHALTRAHGPRKLHSTDSSDTDRIKFWMNAETNDFWEAEASCNYYGGSLAVLGSSGELPATLDMQVTYWIGLLNTKEVPGADGSWSWVDHSPYSVDSTYTAWAEGHPQQGLWCAAMRNNGTAWEWISANCSSPHAMLCELAAEGTTVRQPLSCLHGIRLSGTTLSQPELAAAIPSQVPQLCAEACMGDNQCVSFTATSAGTCQLFQRGSSSVELAYDPEGSLVSCVRYGLDFVSLGQAGAAAAGLAPDADPKCVADYEVGVDDVASQAAASLQECEQLCAPRVECTAFSFEASTGTCRLGSSPAQGLNVVGTGPAQGTTTCLLSNDDWLRVGAWADPSALSAFRGSKVYTLHHEQLSYEDAVAACAAQPGSPGHLAAFSGLPELAFVINKLFIEHTLAAVVPAPDLPPATYGAWIGLTGDAADLLAVLAEGSAELQWADGASVNKTLLQQAWVTDKMGNTRKGLPSSGASCVIISADRSLLKAGFAAAASCDWALPFVCEADLPAELEDSTVQPPPTAPFPEPPQPAQLQQDTVTAELPGSGSGSGSSDGSGSGSGSGSGW
mmetsp:Transcript_36227/g.91490  ORF Transcript_36227/g.91490 Transcript_36227/m.91490 type:complete len:640 (-) Transcript_36227:152-2071(-)